jgi:hypothetical protein
VVERESVFLSEELVDSLFECWGSCHFLRSYAYFSNMSSFLFSTFPQSYPLSQTHQILRRDALTRLDEEKPLSRFSRRCQLLEGVGVMRFR